MASKRKGKKTEDGKPKSPRITNRRAYHDYTIHEKLEVGVALTGSEVKSIRQGRATLAGAFAQVDPATMELWLRNMEISPYDHAPEDQQHDPHRKRKLLAHRREIADLNRKASAKGSTLVPLALYFNSRGLAKVEIGVATGKRHHDKREDMKKKDADRAIRRALSQKKIG